MKLYPLLAGIALSMACFPAFPKWEKSLSRSEMDGVTTLTIASWERGESRRLQGFVIRCSGGDAELYFASGGIIHSYGSGHVDIRLKFDSGEPISEVAKRSSDLTAAFLPDAKKYIAALLRTQRVVLEWTPYNSTATTIVFQVGSLVPFTAEIERHCGT